MSWGFFVDLAATLATRAWDAIRKQDVSTVALAAGWSGLRDTELEAAFGEPPAKARTFARALDARWENARIEIVTEDDETTIRATVFLDRSELELASPLARLFEVVRAAGGSGTLRLVNDGTSAGEDGVELTIVGATTASAKAKPGKVRKTKLASCSPVAEELGAAIAGGHVRASTSRTSRGGGAKTRVSAKVVVEAKGSGVKTRSTSTATAKKTTSTTTKTVRRSRSTSR